jgi:hypothetical protein
MAGDTVGDAGQATQIDSKLERIVTISQTGSQGSFDRLHESEEMLKMNRFFFDLAAKTYVQYDYQGREFTDADQARSFAELLALDLGCTDDQDRPAEVQVRNVCGALLFSVPILNSNLIAA